MVDVVYVSGLNVLLGFPVSLVLLDSDIDTYGSRRGGGVNLESAKHGIVEVSSVLGASASSDGCSGIIPALLVLLGVATEQAGDGGDDDRKVAHRQSNTGLEGTKNGLPNTRDTNDQDGVDEADNGGGDGASEDRNQAEADGGGDANVPENPEGSNNQENIGESLG